MTAEKRSGRRTALLVSGGMVAAAIVFVVLSRCDPSPVMRTEDASAAPHAASTAVEGAVDRSLSSTAERTAVAFDAPVPSTEESTAIVLEVRDSTARLVPGVRIFVTDSKQVPVAHGVTPDGTMRLPRGVTAEAMVDWQATVWMTGRIVSQPVRLSRPGVATIAVGDLGTLRITCEGPDAYVLHVSEPDGDYRAIGQATTEQGRAELQVAAGSVQYLVQTQGLGDLSRASAVTGPRDQGDVVDVHLDMRCCRVVGLLVGGVGEGGISALLFGASEMRSCKAEWGKEGSFSVVVPRMPIESLVFVQRDMFAVCPPSTLDADELDVGVITMVARPRLGRLEVRDPEGTLHTNPPNTVYFTTAAGRERSVGSGQTPIWWRATPDGLECFALPCITEVAVEPHWVLPAKSIGSTEVMVSEPRRIVIRGGGVFRARFVQGGRVVVRLSAPSISSFGTGRQLWLEEVTTKERIPPMVVRGKGQEQDFRGVPPGRYEVCAKGIELVGGALEVLGGSDQEITVSVRPQ